MLPPNSFASMPPPMPRWTWTSLVSFASCPMTAFPMSELGRRPHQMVSGPFRCSFALRPARSLTRITGLCHQGARGASSLPRPPRLLPAGTKVAGWDCSPTGVRRLSTAHSDRLLCARRGNRKPRHRFRNCFQGFESAGRRWPGRGVVSLGRVHRRWVHSHGARGRARRLISRPRKAREARPQGPESPSSHL